MQKQCALVAGTKQIALGLVAFALGIFGHEL